MDMKSPPPYSEAAPYSAYPPGPPHPGYPSGPPHPGYQQPIGFAVPNAPQPPPGYANPSAAHPTTVIVQQPVMTSSIMEFRQNPVALTCPHCHNHIVTKVIYTSGCLSWLLCGILCLFGLWLGCCLIPFCVDGCKNAQHICPTCRRVVGYYAPL